jgi:hypothetical protein
MVVLLLACWCMAVPTSFVVLVYWCSSRFVALLMLMEFLRTSCRLNCVRRNLEYEKHHQLLW